MRLWFRLVTLVLLVLPAPVLGQMRVPIPGVRPEVLGSSFGFAVAVSGNRLAVADAMSSRVFIYTREEGEWRRTARLTLDARVMMGPMLGTASLAMEGDRLVVGAPGAAAVFVYDYDGQEWQRTAHLTPSERMEGAFFGVSVALTPDRLVVGQTPLDRQRGEAEAVYVFGRNTVSGEWTQEARLVPRIPSSGTDTQTAGECFGLTVATRGEEIAVSAHCPNGVFQTTNGRVYRYLREASGWAPAAPIDPAEGVALGDVTFAGDDLIVGSSRGWRVYRRNLGGRTLAAVVDPAMQSHISDYTRALVGIDGAFVGMGFDPVMRRNSVVKFVGGGDTWTSVVVAGSEETSTGSHSFPAPLNTRIALTDQFTLLGDQGKALVLVRDAQTGAIDTLYTPSTGFDVGTNAGRGLDLYAGRLIVGMPGSDLAEPVGYSDRRGSAVVIEPTGVVTSVQGPPDQRNTGTFARIGNNFFVTGNVRHYTTYGLDASVWHSVGLPSEHTLHAIEARGATLAVGTFSSATERGKVELLRCVAGSGCASEAVLTRIPQPGFERERFGVSLGLDRSGTNLAVGAPVIGMVPPNHAPRVSLYARDEGGIWRPDGEIEMPGRPSDVIAPETFGLSVARTRDTVAVTSFNYVYVFVRAPGQSTFRNVARFNVGVAPGPMPTVAVGDGVIAYGVQAPEGFSGQVALFRGASTGTGWVYDRSLNGGTSGGRSFGAALAIDGTRLVVAAPLAANGAGEVYTFDLGTSVAAEREPSPASEALSLRTPNPIRGAATLHYRIDRPAFVRVAVYDMLGRKVATVTEGARAEGAYETPFPPSLVSGAYVVRLDADGMHVTRRVIVLP